MARTAPVAPQYTQREMNPGDMPLGDIPSRDITDGLAGRGPENILKADKAVNNDYFEALAFMEQIVTIRLEQTNQSDQIKKPVLAYPFSVNGRTEWVPTGKAWKVKRKFLEVILRSQPFTVDTEIGEVGDETRNLMHRYASRRYPVSILHDPDPRGPEWHQRVAMEG